MCVVRIWTGSPPGVLSPAGYSPRMPGGNTGPDGAWGDTEQTLQHWLAGDRAGLDTPVTLAFPDTIFDFFQGIHPQAPI